MEPIPGLEFVFGQRKSLHLLLKHTHVWVECSSCSQTPMACQAVQDKNEAPYPRQMKLVGKFQVDRMQLPKLKLGQGHIRRSFPSVGGKDHQIFNKVK